MAFDAYLQIETIKGESTSAGFVGAMEILSFSWGASNPVTIGSHSAGAGGGKVSISSLNLMKKTDAATGALFLACAQGTHIDKVKMTLRKAGGTALNFLVYELEGCFVESIQWSGSNGGDDTPTESLSIAFGKITTTYTPQDKKGLAGKPMVAGYDQTTNAKV